MMNSLLRLRFLIPTLVFLGTPVDLNAAPPQPAVQEAKHEFHFVVLGDSQFHDPSGFNRIIDETARLKPAFVVQVGDMIGGYLTDETSFRAEWARFRNQIAPLGSIPFVPVAGNHDVYDASKMPSALASQVYSDIWGKRYFTWTYGNARFIVLNSDEVGEPHAITGEQLVWLTRTLERDRSPHIFVFMHRPPHLFDNAAALHQLFVKHRVKNVIYGHHHHYHFREQDGVRYIMTNSAATSGTNLDETGSFDHLLFVSVRDGDVSIAPILAGAVKSMDLVAPIDNYDNFALASTLLPEAVPMVKSADRHFTSDLSLHNSTSRAIDVHLTCSSPDDRWQISPVQIPVIRLEAGARQTLRLEFSYAAARAPEGTPTCTAGVPYQTTRGQWLNFADETVLTLPAG